MLLDNFNRNDSVKVGVPAGSTYEYWLEYGEINFGCAGTSCIRLKNNTMEMSRYDWNGTGCLANSAKAANIDMTFKYPTVFSTAPGKLEWYFNMQQSLADPTGFNPGQDGISFVVGSSASDPASSPKGYAVVWGDGSTDAIRLVSFQSNFTNGAFTDMIAVAAPANKTTHLSIRVTYDPCTNEWSLRVRDDGAAFADPSTITGAPVAGETAINNTFTAQNLPYIGGIWNHSAANAVATFDNVYIPNGAVIGSYVWNGSTGTDFQSAANWTPARNCIHAGDRLLFNAGSPANAVLTNVPTQSIRQLWISDNRAVTLKDVAGDGATTVLTITGSTGTDLKIDAGASLTLDVNGNAQDAMTISLAAGTTGNISGNFVFGDPAGTGANAHRLLASDANAIVVASGGVIKAARLDGNAFGNGGTPNVIVFNSGSAYENDAGPDPFGLALAASKVVFNRGSVYKHFSDTPPSLAGRTYANFQFSANTIITEGLNAAVCTMDTLNLVSGSLQLTGTDNGQAVSTYIKGDLLISAGATFDYSPAVASTLTFNSTFAAQKITCQGTLVLGRDLTVKLNSSFATPQLYVQNDIAVAGILHIASGTLQLNGNIRLLSDAVRTASVAAVTGNINYGAGRFIAERYIPAHKAWQLLAVPTTTGQTIRDAWQEGSSPGADVNPGYGTIITSNIAGHGFDILTPAGPSMKIYNSATNAWEGIPNTDTDPVANKKGYMLIVRGDRSVTTSNAAATPTVLRTTGKLFAPGVNAPPVSTVAAGKFESVGNPYASAIDFNLVTRTGGVQNVFYVWDPHLSGDYGLGGYQTFTYNGTSYDVIPGGGSYTGTNRNIESGQAFFARCTSPAGNITFSENCKVSASSLVNRGGPVFADQLRTNLYVVMNGNPVLMDGVLSRFNAAYDNGVDMEDAFKIDVPGESIAILRNGDKLAAEKRGYAGAADTVFYTLERLRQQQYQLQFATGNFHIPGVTLFLADRWLGTKTLVPQGDTAIVAFNVTADAASAASGRFSLILEHTLPVYAPGSWIRIQPNPVAGKILRLVFSGAPAGNYKLQLLNTAGQVVYTHITNISQNVQEVVLKTGVPQGNYLLQVNGPREQTVLQVMIR
jgi:hypothetical protein